MGHRGSLGHFPEHTLAGYTDAWLLGVDWVELDLNVTADGILIAQHDQCLMESTDAMLYDALWSDRRKTVVLPSGHTCTRDFMVPDFELGELRMVKRRQRFEFRSPWLDGLFGIPTFEEAIQHMYNLKKNYTVRTNGDHVVPGLYIELKEPQWYLDAYGFDVVQMIFDQLSAWNLETIDKATENGIPIIIQSFDPDALKRFSQLSDLPLVQLAWWGHTGVVYDWEDISTWAHGVGPDSKYVMFWPDTNTSTQVDDSPSAFINYMHSLDLQVHPWTLRDDELLYRDNSAAENALYFNKGVDGIFTEFVSTTWNVFETLANQKNQTSPAE